MYSWVSVFKFFQCVIHFPPCYLKPHSSSSTETDTPLPPPNTHITPLPDENWQKFPEKNLRFFSSFPAFFTWIILISPF